MTTRNAVCVAAILLAGSAFATVTTTPMGCPLAALHDDGWDDELNTCHERLYEAPAEWPQASPATETDEFNDTSLDGKWSWTNQGGATWTEQDGYGLLTAPGGSSDNWRILQQTTPSTPFTIIARMTFATDAPNTQFAHGSLILRNSSNGRFVSFGNGLRSGGLGVEIDSWSSVTANNGQTAIVLGDQLRAFQYHKLVVSSTTAVYSVSPDGIVWNVIGTETFSSYLTASGGSVDRVGFGVSVTNSADAHLAVYWFRKS